MPMNPSANRVLLIINPISGTGSKQGVAEKVLARLNEHGFEAEVKYTGGRGDATRLAAAAADQNFAGVLACGGDGTVNETARALCGRHTALGILPAGSGNGLARHIGIPVDIDLALDIILKNNVIAVDYGSVNQTPFFCTFGMGFDAAVSHRFARQSRRGLISYVRSALREYIQYKPQTYTLSANGKILTEKAFLVAVANASQWGNNAYIAPQASITDGLLDIIIVHSGSPIDAAVMGMDIFTGFINKNTMVHCFRAPAAVIYRNNPGEAHIDGEPMMLDNILEIKCHPAALKVYAPEIDNGPVRPIVTPVKEFIRDAKISLSHLIKSITGE